MGPLQGQFSELAKTHLQLSLIAIGVTKENETEIFKVTALIYCIYNHKLSTAHDSDKHKLSYWYNEGLNSF